VNASDPAQVWGEALRCGPDAPRVLRAQAPHRLVRDPRGGGPELWRARAAAASSSGRTSRTW